MQALLEPFGESFRMSIKEAVLNVKYGPMMWRQLHRAITAQSGIHCNRRSRFLRALPSHIHNRIHETPIASNYEPKAIEAEYLSYWQSLLSASPHNNAPIKKYTLLLPPPNITGSLHIGHALTLTIQDALIRWHHMRNYRVSWIPGLDHAGIATQSVVERHLLKYQNATRHDMGREQFVNAVMQWKEQYGTRILDQFESLGALLDTKKFYFTLDEERSKAVTRSFVELYRRNLIYRKRRMINWCPFLNTAISDVEVDMVEITKPTKMHFPGSAVSVELGVMHRLKYQIDGEAECFLHVDTTRPETLFGDVALAVHSKDKRYKQFHGKFVRHPMTNERMPIIVDDSLVDMELGTGVVKITPSHDTNDFECALRHNLPEKAVIDQKGRMCGAVPSNYLGLDRFQARNLIIKDLESRKLYVGKILHSTSIPVCSRSGDLIEPFLLPQWFVKCDKMAERAANHVRHKIVSIEPEQHKSVWYNFLDNVKDWCISRQLWWGHRIPAYRLKTRTSEEEWIVAESIEEALVEAQHRYSPSITLSDLVQDEDVLDTWFSSALLPLSSQKWTGNQNELQNIDPISLMETGSDILFFWVGRMMMLCEELSGKIPFHKIFLHPLVRDKSGRKMSKSLGNVINPKDVIDGASLNHLIQTLQNGNISEREYEISEKNMRKEFPEGIPESGTDALRLALCSYLQQSTLINMDIYRVILYRNFCNKLWHAVKYALLLLDNQTSGRNAAAILKEIEHASIVDRWILSRLARAVQESNSGLSSNRLALSVLAIQNFIVQDLCDVYIEFSKPILYGNRISLDEFEKATLCARQSSAKAVLFTCLDTCLRCLHPFAPFITEELWQRLQTLCEPRYEKCTASILSQRYPEENGCSMWIDTASEASMNTLIEVLGGIRSLRQMLQKVSSVKPKDTLVHLDCEDTVTRQLIQENAKSLEMQTGMPICLRTLSAQETKVAMLTLHITSYCSVRIGIEKNKSTSERVHAELHRLRKRFQENNLTIHKILQTLEEQSHRIPEHIKARNADRVSQLQSEQASIEKTLEALETLKM